MRVLITGASRGIGAAVARTFAQRHGSRLHAALLGRSLDSPSHPALRGTLLQTAEDVEALGGVATVYGVDMRDPGKLKQTLELALHDLDGLDVLINNASVLLLKKTATPREMDLVHTINAVGTMLCLDSCAPHLNRSRGSVVTMAPPINLRRMDWISDHVPYTLSKYCMTLATLAHASKRVRANTLWPKRTVRTAATEYIERSGKHPNAFTDGRSADEVARAVHVLATSPGISGQTLYDEDVCRMPHSRAPLDAFVD